jgi:hypothetical protein
MVDPETQAINPNDDQEHSFIQSAVQISALQWKLIFTAEPCRDCVVRRVNRK